MSSFPCSVCGQYHEPQFSCGRYGAEVELVSRTRINNIPIEYVGLVDAITRLAAALERIADGKDGGG